MEGPIKVSSYVKPVKNEKLILSETGIHLISVPIILVALIAFMQIAEASTFKEDVVSRRFSTREKMEKIYEAVMGNPNMGTFGYVGDMGKLPDSLNDLTTNPGSTSYISMTNKVFIGWNGPYINIGLETEDFKEDEWNNLYLYSTKNGNNLLTSVGPDKQVGTLDDIVFQSADPFSISPIQDDSFYNGSIILRIINSQEALPFVRVYYSNNGQETFLTSGVDFSLSIDPCNPCIAITNPIPVHQGIHAVEVIVGGKTVFDNVSVYAGDTTTVTLGTDSLPVFCNAICGIDSVRFSGRPVVDSYSSTGGFGTGGNVGSNGWVDVDNGTVKGGVAAGTDLISGPNGEVWCDVLVGEDTDDMEGTISGKIEYGFDPSPCCIRIDVDSIVNAAETNNNNDDIDSQFLNGTHFSISGNDTTTLNAGTYYFTKFDLKGKAKVNINGVVKIRMDSPGNFKVTGNGASLNKSGTAANLDILSNASGDVDISGNGFTFYGVVYAPRADISVSGNPKVYGALLGKTVFVSGNNTKIHYDVTLPYAGSLCTGDP